MIFSKILFKRMKFITRKIGKFPMEVSKRKESPVFNGRHFLYYFVILIKKNKKNALFLKLSINFGLQLWTGTFQFLNQSKNCAIN